MEDYRRNAFIHILPRLGTPAKGLTHDLLEKYVHRAEQRAWQVEIISQLDIGALRDIILRVIGDGAYGELRGEAGFHSEPVQRAESEMSVPSAMVIVLPEIGEAELAIPPEDVRIDVLPAAVRVTHLPSGNIVTCTSDRPLLQNKANALAVLRARLYEREH